MYITLVGTHVCPSSVSWTFGNQKTTSKQILEPNDEAGRERNFVASISTFNHQIYLSTNFWIYLYKSILNFIGLREMRITVKSNRKNLLISWVWWLTISVISLVISMNSVKMFVHILKMVNWIFLLYRAILLQMFMLTLATLFISCLSVQTILKTNWQI